MKFVPYMVATKIIALNKYYLFGWLLLLLFLGTGTNAGFL